MRAAVDSPEHLLILQGDASEYALLIEQLVSAPVSVTFDGAAIDEHSSPIGSLDVGAGDGPLVVGVETGRASIVGSCEVLEALAADIRAFVEHNDLLEPGAHTHIEPSWTPSGQTYLAKQSASVLLLGPIPQG